MKPIGCMLVCFSLWFVFLCVPGCNRGGSAIDPPQLDPAKVGQAAVQQYDLNNNGVIEGDELTAAASLESAMSQLDVDEDQKLTAEEIAAYVQSWQDAGVGLTSVNCRLTWKGQPLAGAKVTFHPEDFQGNAVAVAEGISDQRGTVRLALEDGPQRGWPDGMQLGFYRVHISKIENGNEIIPPKYNEDSTLGRAVTADGRLNSIVFQLP
jgi:hypothetical protein